MSKKVIMFTDGACSNNPGKGGIGIVLLYGDHRKEVSKGYKNTTNNRMELRAVIEGLKLLNRSCEVVVYSDSAYLTKAINNGWLQKWEKNNWINSTKQKVKNIDLWKQLMELLKIHKVEFIWIKGHENNKENERADKLAREAILSKNLLNDDNYSGE